MLKDKWPWLLLAVAVFISSLYEYGYWTVFHFRAFEYFTIESLIQNFAYVIISGFKLSSLFLLIGIVPSIAAQFATGTEQTEKNGFEKFKEKYPKVFGIAEGVVGTSMLLLFAIIAFFRPPIESFWYTLLFISVALSTAIERRLAGVASPILRLWCTYFFLSYSLTALETGRDDALAIIRNEKPSLVTFSEAEQKIIGCKQAKFIGVLGDCYALLTTDNQQVFLVLKSRLPTLRLDRARRTMATPRQ